MWWYNMDRQVLVRPVRLMIVIEDASVDLTVPSNSKLSINGLLDVSFSFLWILLRTLQRAEKLIYNYDNLLGIIVLTHSLQYQRHSNIENHDRATVLFRLHFFYAISEEQASFGYVWQLGCLAEFSVPISQSPNLPISKARPCVRVDICSTRIARCAVHCFLRWKTV